MQLSHPHGRYSSYHPLRLFGRFVLLPLVLALIALSGIQAARAEGSRNLVASGGYRPYLEWSGQQTAGIQRRSLLYVYVRAGEEVSLGSSVPTSFTDPQDIIYRSPAGTQNGSCDVQAGGFALIDTLAKEAAGPLPNPGGYTPCTFVAAETGVYEVEFHGPQFSTSDIGNPPPLPVGSPFPTDASQLQTVAAWDITVRATPGGAIQSGRVFANYLALNMGGGAANLDATVYILTRDGFLYQVDLNGQRPFGFVFFGNDDGFIDPATQNGLYRSVQLSLSDQFLPDATVHNPGLPDTAVHVTHKIFLQPPDPTLPSTAPYPGGTMWLLNPPTPPAPPTGFGFTGIEGTPGQAGSGLGGNFTFNASFQGSYTITLDTNQNGLYTDPVDRVLIGSAQVGVNTVFWDGLDGQGNPVPASGAPYTARITLNGGEVHFPFFDVENNPNGFIIQRINGPGTLPEPTFYYNDDYGTFGSQPGAPVPIQALTGIVSPAHAFTNNFGDHKGIDSWTYVPSGAVLFDALQVRSADLATSKSHSPATFVAGGLVSYTITVTNNGPSAVTNAVFTDTIPAEITGVSWTCAITSGAGSCGAAGGTGNAINTTVSLNSGAVATYTVSGTLSAGASGSLTNTANIIRPADVSDPNPANNPSTDVAPIGQGADLAVTKTVSHPNPAEGDTITYTISITNNGPSNATGVQVSDPLPGGLTYVSSSATQGSYNSGTGVWTVGGLNVGNSASLTITAQVNTGTAGQTLTNTAVVSADQGDQTPGNNTAQAALTVRGTPVVPTPGATPTGPVIEQIDPSINKSVFPANALPGETVTWTIEVSNPGTQPTASVTMTDPVPAMFTITSVTTTRGVITQSGNLVTVQIGVLQPGERVRIVIETVASTEAPAGRVTNVAYAGRVSDDAAVQIYPPGLPPTGGRPLRGAGWSGLAVAAGLIVLGMGSYLLVRRRRR